GGEIIGLLEGGDGDAARGVDRARGHRGRLGGLQMRAQADAERLRAGEHARAILLQPLDVEDEARRLERIEALRVSVEERFNAGHLTSSTSCRSDAAVKSGRHGSTGASPMRLCQ